jgi:hypothetical protein
MTYEERYFELLEKVDRAKDRIAQNPFSVRARDNYQWAMDEFSELCMEILEKLMEENSDVLARLK